MIILILNPYFDKIVKYEIKNLLKKLFRYFFNFF